MPNTNCPSFTSALFASVHSLLDKRNIGSSTAQAYSWACVLQFLVQIQIFHYLGCDLFHLIWIKLRYCWLKFCYCHFYHPFWFSFPYYTTLHCYCIAASPTFPTAYSVTRERYNRRDWAPPPHKLCAHSAHIEQYFRMNCILTKSQIHAILNLLLAVTEDKAMLKINPSAVYGV